MNNKIKVYSNLEKIIVLSGKMKGHLSNKDNLNHLTIEKFKDSVIDLKETTIEKNNPFFINLIKTTIEKIKGVETLNFEYAASMRNVENEMISTLISCEIKLCDSFIIGEIKYYFVYVV